MYSKDQVALSGTAFFHSTLASAVSYGVNCLTCTQWEYVQCYSSRLTVRQLTAFRYPEQECVAHFKAQQVASGTEDTWLQAWLWISGEQTVGDSNKWNHQSIKLSDPEFTFETTGRWYYYVLYCYYTVTASSSKQLNWGIMKDNFIHWLHRFKANNKSAPV